MNRGGDGSSRWLLNLAPRNLGSSRPRPRDRGSMPRPASGVLALSLEFG